MVLFPFYRKRRIMKPIKYLNYQKLITSNQRKTIIMVLLIVFISDAYIKYFNQLPFSRQYLGMNYHR